MNRIEIIAEIGNNAGGDVALACRMIDAAAEAGADTVKFQVIHPDALVVKDDPAHRVLCRESFTDDDFRQLKEHSDETGVEFLATPFDVAAVELLAGLDVRRCKVASGDITYRALLERIGTMGKPVLLATGASTDDQIRAALGWLRDAGCPEITLLHCIACYPAPDKEMNLPRISRLQETFGLPVGLSDHSAGWAMPLGAAALGATVIEKHFTIDQSLPGGDNAISILPVDLRILRDALDRLQQGLIDHGPRPVPCEDGFIAAARRCLVAAGDLPAGHCLHAEDIVALRGAPGMPAELAGECIDCTLAIAVAAGAPLRATDLAKGGNE